LAVKSQPSANTACAKSALHVFFLLAETAALPYVVPKPQLPSMI
jgi:hypothetical protein